jgi:hypothetical protein
VKATASGEAIRHLSDVAAALGQKGQPASVLAALDRATAATLGHRLFTGLLYRAETGESERVYTSHPAAYPVGGRKAVRETTWTARVFGERRAYVGRGPEDIRAAFLDHELIFSLGCQSVLNLPVVFDGRVLGTVNLLHQAAWYTEDHVPLGLCFAALAVPAYLALVG